MSFAEQVKSKILNIISEMAQHPDDFSKKPGVDFSRKRKLDFATFLHLFISMEDGTVRNELLKYFSFCSIITQNVVINIKGKKHLQQVNYSVAYKACHYLLRQHGIDPPPDIESLIERNTLPIRLDRKYARQHRFRVPVSFTYRFS